MSLRTLDGIHSTVASGGTAFFSTWGSWPEVKAGVVPTDLIAFESSTQNGSLRVLRVVGIHTWIARHGGSVKPGPFTYYHEVFVEAKGMERGYLLIARAKLQMGFNGLVNIRFLRASWCQILSSPRNLKWILQPKGVTMCDHWY